MDDSEEITPETIDEECKKYLMSPAAYEVDEEYLLDLIETALDNANYTSAWLLIGAALTHYPDNHFIWLHLAYLLYEEGQSDYARIVLGKYKKKDFWADSLMVLIDSESAPEQVRDKLKKLILTPEIFHEDTLVNVISVARETDNYEFLIGLLPELARKTDAINVLWSEMASWAELRQDTDAQLQYIENYIDACPYDAEAWELRARYFLISKPDPDEALASAEYALAINPQSILGHLARFEASIMKIHAGMDMPNDQKETLLKSILHAVNTMPSGAMFLDHYASFVVVNNLLDDERIQSLTYDFNKRYPENKAIVDLMLRMSENNSEWEIQDFVLRELAGSAMPAPEDETTWVEWSRILRSDKKFHASLAILLRFYESTKIAYNEALDKDAFLEMLYLSGRYDAIDNIRLPEMEDPLFIRVALHKLLAMARLGNYDGIMPMATKILAVAANNDAWYSLNNQLADVAIGSVCLRLIEWAQTPPRRKRKLMMIDPYGPQLICLGYK